MRTGGTSFDNEIFHYFCASIKICNRRKNSKAKVIDFTSYVPNSNELRHAHTPNNIRPMSSISPKGDRRLFRKEKKKATAKERKKKNFALLSSASGFDLVIVGFVFSSLSFGRLAVAVVSLLRFLVSCLAVSLFFGRGGFVRHIATALLI